MLERHLDSLARGEQHQVEVRVVPRGLLVAGEALVAAGGRRPEGAGKAAECRENTGFLPRLEPDPGGIVHVGLEVLVRQEAVFSPVRGVADDEEPAARLAGIIPVADEKHAVAVPHAIARTDLKDVVHPGLRLGPEETSAHGPAAGEGLPDFPELLIREALRRVPWLDPVELKSVLEERLGLRQCLRRWLQSPPELRKIRHVLLEANAVSFEAFPQVGKEAAIFAIVGHVIRRPVEELHAQATAAPFLFREGELQGPGHHEDRAGVALALESGREAPAILERPQVRAWRQLVPSRLFRGRCFLRP
jgi:hypothetical protein